MRSTSSVRSSSDSVGESDSGTPRSASRSRAPRPRFFAAMPKCSLSVHVRRCGCALAPQHLAGKSEIGDRAARFAIVQIDRLAMTRRLGQPDVSRNNRTQQLVAEMFAELRGYIVGEIVAHVVHGAQQSFDFQIR